MSAYASIADVPHRQARERPEKPALHFAGGTLRYAELDDRVRRFAAFVAEAAGPGARVALLLPNVPELAIAYFGAIAAGAVAVPVNLRLAPAEVGYVVNDCAASIFVTTPDRLERLAAMPELQGVRSWVTVDTSVRPGGVEGRTIPFDAALDRAPVATPAAARPDDVACLLYTSGTTGFPKGAMISHGNALFNAESCRRTLGYGADDVGLVTLPLFHVTALHSQLVAHLAVGGTVVLQREYETAAMVELAARHRATSLFLVPAIYKLLTMRPDVARHDLSAVRVAAYGGAPMDAATIRGLRGLFPGVELHNCYGLTESSSLATVLPDADALSHADSVGLPVPGTEAEVRDEAGEPLPPEDPGELWLRGPHIVQGYWAAPEKTRAALVGGWLRTGDVARIDRDGYVHVLDRVKDMINRGGEKIYGLEVENVLYGHPGVAEAAVVGVPHPIFGEVPVAFVAAFPGAALDGEGLRVHCATRLADFKVPTEVRFVDKLPRNPGGKVLKAELRRIWETNPTTR